MTQGQVDDARLVEYLLGRVGEEEQAEIEQRYVSDPDFLAELQAVERDLIDQYVRGELADRAAFESRFLSSPSRRQKVEFARALMQSSAGAARQPRPAARYRPLQLAAAAAVLLAVGAWLVLSNRPTIDQQQAGTNAPAPTPPSTPALPSPPAPAPPPVAAARVVTLMLSPTLVRSAGDTSVLTLGDATDVRLQLELESGAYVSYRALVRTADGVEVWRQELLQAQPVASGRAVVIDVPASRFSNNDYTVTLSGVTSSGGVDELDGYVFRAIVRR